MIFGKRKEYQLPKFPSRAVPTFRSLCEPLSVSEVEELRRQVNDSLESLHSQARSNALIDVNLADQVAERCIVLLDRYQGLSTEEKALASGAVRYFAIADDAFSDVVFATGLEDDVKVINHVLEELGIADHFIILS